MWIFVKRILTNNLTCNKPYERSTVFCECFNSFKRCRVFSTIFCNFATWCEPSECLHCHHQLGINRWTYLHRLMEQNHGQQVHDQWSCMSHKLWKKRSALKTKIIKKEVGIYLAYCRSNKNISVFHFYDWRRRLIEGHFHLNQVLWYERPRIDEKRNLIRFLSWKFN